MLKESEVVKTKKSFGDKLPEGSKGTIVLVFPGNPTKYDVEFLEEGTPYTIDIVTIEENDLELVWSPYNQ